MGKNITQCGRERERRKNMWFCFFCIFSPPETFIFSQQCRESPCRQPARSLPLFANRHRAQVLDKPKELRSPGNTLSRDHCEFSQWTPGRGNLECAYEYHVHGGFLPCPEVGIAFLASGSRKKQLLHKQQLQSFLKCHFLKGGTGSSVLFLEL